MIVIKPVINTCKKVLTRTLQPCEKAAILFDETFSTISFSQNYLHEKELSFVSDKRFNLFFQPTCIWPL